MSRLALIKAGFKDGATLNRIPHEVLDGLEMDIIKTWNKQKAITDPTMKSVVNELRETSAQTEALAGLVRAIVDAPELDHAEVDLEIFRLRTRAQFKVMEQLMLLGEENEKDKARLFRRLDELREEKDQTWAEPVNALNWEALESAELDEINLHIDWFRNNEVPIKKKVLYSFIATTNGGKTIIKSWMAYELLKVGANVLYLAQEEPYSDTIRRVYQNTLNITEKEYRDRTVDGFQSIGEEYNRMASELKLGQFFVVEWPGIGIDKIEKYIERHREIQGEIDVIIIDYGKLVETKNKNKIDKEYERIGSIFKELKQLAMKQNVAVITSVQLNRESSNAMIRKNQTPTLSDVAGAYEAMHHANYVWSISKKQIPTDSLQVDYRDPFRILGTFTLHVQKQKYGNLKEGDFRSFIWRADHTLEETNISHINEPTIEM